MRVVTLMPRPPLGDLTAGRSHDELAAYPAAFEKSWLFDELNQSRNFKQWFKKLQAPVGAHYLIGDQVSYHPGWQEGAIASAHHAIADIDARVRAGGSQVVRS